MEKAAYPSSKLSFFSNLSVNLSSAADLRVELQTKPLKSKTLNKLAPSNEGKTKRAAHTVNKKTV